jgi:hypothetical protein
MNQKASNLSNFSIRWSDALDRTQPAFDESASRERWLARFTEVAPLQGRGAQRWHWVVAAAILLSVLLVFGYGRLTAIQADQMNKGAWVETQTGQTLPLEFSEGSKVVVEEASRVRVAEVHAEGARLVIERGRLNATITRRPNTDWSFSSGPFNVQVTGTALGIQWDPETKQFAVNVSEGSVWVTGPMLENGRSISAGQRCLVRLAESHLEVTRSNEAPPSSSSTNQRNGLVDLPEYKVKELPVLSSTEPLSPPPIAPAVEPKLNKPNWRELERQAKYREALEAAKTVGLEVIYANGSADDLMSLARVARLSGSRTISRRALESCRQRFSGDHRAATAAFLLGRAAPPGEAARWFATYLREAPSGALAREAAGRLVESHHRAGNLGAAHQAAETYLQRYPDGPHATFARSILEVNTTQQ